MCITETIVTKSVVENVTIVFVYAVENVRLI